MLTFAESGEDLPVKDAMTHFTLDIIAACGFGVQANAFDKEDSKFKEMVINYLFNFNLDLVSKLFNFD